jgi:hypothetical protein
MSNQTTTVLLEKMSLDPAVTYQGLRDDELAALPSVYRTIRSQQSYSTALFAVLIFIVAFLPAAETMHSLIGGLVIAVALTTAFVYYRVTRASREFARLTPEVSFDRVRLWALERERKRLTKHASHGTAIVLIVLAMAAVLTAPDRVKQEAALRDEAVNEIKTLGGSGPLATFGAEALRTVIAHNDLNCTGLLGLQYRNFWFGSALVGDGKLVSFGMFGHVFFFSGSGGESKTGK